MGTRARKSRRAPIARQAALFRHPVPDALSTMDDPLDPLLSLAFAAREGRVEARGESVVAQLGLTGGGEPTPLAFGPTTPGAPAETVDTKLPVADGARYQILEEIGRGGLGLVLRGRDVDLRRDVAVKVLRSQFADRKDLVERFLLEAQLGGQLQHPGIAPVYDLGITRDGRPFFTMKLVQGSTLAELLVEREDWAGRTVHLLGIFSQICKAVGYAHARGVVHRDLKPVNVMVGEFGEVQVVDWGLAKVAGHPDELVRDDRNFAPDLSAAPDSRPGTVLGTPGYMAPEQARGEAVGPASDVYSLGVMLFEILAGRRLPESVEGELGDAEEVRALLDGQDLELQRLVSACLAPEPASRPHDALQVARGIDAHMTRSEERAHEAQVHAAREEARAGEAQARLLAESRARRLTLFVAAGVLVALIAGWSTWAVISEQSSRRELAASLEIEAALGRATTKQAEALAREQAGKWTEALEAARGALAIATVQSVNPILEKRAQSLVGELEDQLRMTLERDRRRELAAAFEQDLRALREQASRDSPPSVHFEALQASFTAYGHSLEDGLTLEHKRRLEADGLCELAIQVLDTLGI
ncbi:MAG: serine/threonine protein kinase, partial [Planctomycetota bacterium]